MRVASVTAPWRDDVPVAWAIGPSTHPTDDHEHHGSSDVAEGVAIDPVCGMTVIPAVATEKGLHLTHGGVEYYFCGKGCVLDFRDEPERFLDPKYVPSM